MSTNTAKKALATRKEQVAQRRNDDKPVLERHLASPEMQQEFKKAMPKGRDAEQLVRDVITATRHNPKLLQAEPMSVLGAAMTCAQLGLRVGVLGHAWILPFDRRTREEGEWRTVTQAQLIIGYQGYRELAHRSGLINSITAQIVYTNDEFDIRLGTDGRIHHIPNIDGPRGDARGYYAVAKYNNGGYVFEYISKLEAEEHRDKFAMAKDRNGNIVGPWRDHFDAMAMKTAFLKMAKWMPKTPELDYAIHADSRVRTDLSEDGIHTGVLPMPGPQLLPSGSESADDPDLPQEFSDEPWTGE